jgi:signal transduction histidine kinase
MTAQPNEPHDLSLDWVSGLIHGALIFAASALFLVTLPWWQPLAWALLYNVALLVRRWLMKRCTTGTAQQRLWAGRYTHWSCAACAGSAAYWLFVPGDQLMQVALVVCLLCIITSMVLESVGDFWRIAVSLSLVVVPTATRLLFQDNLFSIVLGLGGYVAGTGWWLLWKRQQAIWQEQYALRQQAEVAAQALASATLARARFFAAANHDLRQPVHAMGLYLGMLESTGSKPHDPSVLQGLRRSWNALSDLLTQLLDVSRAEAGALQPQLKSIHLVDALHEQVVHHSPAASAHGQRLVTLGGHERYVMADPLMLARVLGNLVDNAIKFSPRGATIVIAARQGTAHDVRIQVRDAGPGIAPEDQERVFDDFTQIGNPQRDRGAGFGLGLAIARRFTAAMGGSLHARSALGAGCTMQLRLPRAEAPRWLTTQPLQISPAVSQVTTQSDWRVRGIHRLLVLEDDPLVAQAMQSLAQTWNLPCEIYSHGRDILQAATPGDVALCDFRLPQGPTGLDVALSLRMRKVAVALVTGEADRNLRAQALQHQLDLLIKPVTAPNLHALLLRLSATAP